MPAAATCWDRASQAEILTSNLISVTWKSAQEETDSLFEKPVLQN